MNEHRAILALGRIILELHPVQNDLARIGVAVGCGVYSRVATPPTSGQRTVRTSYILTG